VGCAIDDDPPRVTAVLADDPEGLSANAAHVPRHYSRVAPFAESMGLAELNDALGTFFADRPRQRPGRACQLRASGRTPQTIVDATTQEYAE
jgi:fermentation-respiration switch protein FrsA (DUF1100 family)